MCNTCGSARLSRILTLYRRHLKACPHRSRRSRRCQCPIHVEGSLRGEFIRKGLDLTSWEAASDLIAQWNAAGEIGVVKPEIPTIAEAVTRYFEDATARQLSSATIQKQKILLEKRLLAWAESKGYRLLKQLDVDALRQFRATWPDGALSAYKNLERLRAFFRFCETSGWTRGPNPARAVKPPKVTPNPTLPFTKAEMRKIVAACDEYPGRNSFRHDNRARVRAFVMLLRYSGLRIRDAATLRRDRLQGSKLFLYQQKTGTPVYVPLPPQAVDALTALNTDNEYFFWTGNGNPKTVVADWQRSLGRVFMLANIEGGHAHRFRDTFAVELLLGGVPIDQVSVLLGHSSVKITEKHYSPWVKARQQKLEQLVKQAWSRS